MFFSFQKSKKRVFYLVIYLFQNLYGLAQMSKLPISNLEWLQPEIASSIDWKNIDTELSIGYILEVDLIYPKNLHLKHDNFPLAPENIRINFENLSPYAKRSLVECGNSNVYSDVKLSATFHDRLNYVLHFKNLKLYLNLGMKLKRIHRVLSFKQENFIAPFIERCTLNRQASKTKFEQDQFKKVANSTYGKTIQNVRNYLIVKLHVKPKSLLKAVANPTFKSFSILDENLVQTNHFTPVILHDKPIFIGFTILELSKEFMYDFYYNKMVKNIQSKIDLGFSDTDSFLFKVNNSKSFNAHIKQYMDFSNFNPTHENFSEDNKSQLGFFKNELGGKYKCLEFVGLRAKCYSLNLMNTKDESLSEKKTCKGLGRVAIQNKLKFKHYKDSLFNRKVFRFDYNSIRSVKQNVRTVRLKKKALSHFDSKRWLFDCGIHSVPYGSYIIEQFYNACPKC